MVQTHQYAQKSEIILVVLKIASRNTGICKILIYENCNERSGTQVTRNCEKFTDILATLATTSGADGSF
jgi:hypothetical protein